MVSYSRSAKPLCAGSIPARASNFSNKLTSLCGLSASVERVFVCLQSWQISESASCVDLISHNDNKQQFEDHEACILDPLARFLNRHERLHKTADRKLEKKPFPRTRFAGRFGRENHLWPLRFCNIMPSGSFSDTELPASLVSIGS